MAWNIHGLCILVIGAAGIVNAVSLVWHDRAGYPRNMPSEWNYKKRFDLYTHLHDLHHEFEPLDYQDYLNQFLVTRKPLNLPKVKIPDNWLRFKKLTTTHAMKSSENSILVSDTYDDVPENLVGCNGTKCVEKLQVISSSTIKNNTEKNVTELNSSSSIILPNTPESSSPQSESVSTNSSKSNQNTTLNSTPVSDVSPTTNEANNSDSSYFNTGSTILLTQTSETSEDGDGSVIPTVSFSSTLTLDNSTDGESTLNVSASDDETTFPTRTSENSTDDDESADASTSYSPTFSIDNQTDEVTVAPNTPATNETDSTDISSTLMEKNLTTNSEISSDITVQSTAISKGQETSESSIPSQAKFNSSTEAQWTSSQNPEENSPGSDSISSTTDEGSFDSSTSVYVEKTTMEISHTLSSKGSTSSKSEITTETISQDHNLKISSIRTARMIVTVVFLVILLIAVGILAVYVFKAKRRAVEYDQLVLLP